MSASDSFCYVDNPLIFFVFNKVDCMREEDIITICTDFYDELEISDAKKFIFECNNRNDELINRKGANKTKSDLQDVIRLIRTGQPKDNVKFCVTSCVRLPSVALQHIDAAALMKIVAELRTEVLLLKPLKDEILDVKNKIKNLELPRNPPNLNEIQDFEIHSLKNSQKFTPSVRERVSIINSSNLINNKIITDKHKELNNQCELNRDSPEKDPLINIYPDLKNIFSPPIVERDLDSESTSTDNEIEIKEKHNLYPKEIVKVSKFRQRIISNSNNRTIHKSGFQSNLKGIPNRHKLKSDFKIKAATSKRPIFDLFISRIDPNENISSIENHLIQICGNNTRCSVYKLQSRHHSYATFRAIIYNSPLNINLLQDRYWPEGVYITHFRKRS